MQRRSAKQHCHIKSFAVHGLDLRDRVIIPRHGEIITIGHLLLAVIDNVGDRTQCFLAAAQLEFHPAVLAVSLPRGIRSPHFGFMYFS